MREIREVLRAEGADQGDWVSAILRRMISGRRGHDIQTSLSQFAALLSQYSPSSGRDGEGIEAENYSRHCLHHRTSSACIRFEFA